MVPILISKAEGNQGDGTHQQPSLESIPEVRAP